MDSSWCFTLAKSTGGHEELIEANLEMAGEKRKEIELGNKSRVIIEGCL